MTKTILSYDEFKQTVVDEINEQLRHYVPEVTAELRMVPKVNGFREALNFDAVDKKESFSYTPNFYMRDYYSSYCDGTSLERILRKIFNTYLDYDGWRIWDDRDFSTPENICRVVCMLINRNVNAELLEMIPHRDFLDLAVIYRVVVRMDDKSLFSYILNNSVFEKWDMTEEELFERAKIQTDAILEPDDSMSGDSFGVLTNKLGINGSGAILSTDRLRRMADRTDDDIYIIPSSINEIFTAPVKLSYAEELKASLRTSLETGIVEPEEWLSNNLYRFSRKTGKVSIV